MDGRQHTPAAEWRLLIDMVRESIPPSDEVLDRLVGGYDRNTVARGQRLGDQMLLPRPCRPRVSPSSLAVLGAAHDFGCFFAIAPLRAPLTLPVTEDTRWQSGYLQQHIVVETASRADSNVEIHDLAHSMLGLMWWPSISRHNFYLASRLSEATAAYHYYFMDQVLEPRCETHSNIVDLARIWKFNICPDCNAERNYYFNLSPARQATARSVGLECIRQARAFYFAELKDIAAQAVDGVRFIERNPVNLAANAADALRYAHYTLPVLSHPRLDPYLAALRSWRKCGSFEEYLTRATRIIRILNGLSEPASAPALQGGATLPGRRRLAVIEDLQLRLGLVLAQHDLGLRPLPPADAELLAACAARTASLASHPAGETDDEVTGVFQQLASRPTQTSPAGDGGTLDAVRAVGAVGYDPVFAMRALPGAGKGNSGASTDFTHVVPMLADLVTGVLPRTSRYLRGAGTFNAVLAAFRDGQERWATVEPAPGDGLVPRDDKTVQRFLLLLNRLSREDTALARTAAVAAEIAAVEHEYARFQVRARADLDLRDEPPGEYPADGTILQVSAVTQLHRCDADIDRPRGERGRPNAGQLTYVFSAIRNRTYLSRLSAPLAAILGELQRTPVTAAGLRARLEAAGLGTSDAARLSLQWLKTGVISPRLTGGRAGGEPVLTTSGA